MFTNTVFGLFFVIMINFYSVSADHWIYSRSTTQPRIINNVSNVSNDTDFFEELAENNVTITTESDVLFWTKPDTEVTVQGDSEVNLESDSLDRELESDNTTLHLVEDSTELEINVTTPVSISTTEVTQGDPQPEKTQTNNVTETYVPDVANIMDEKIILQRNNCHLEIAVQESYDLKIEIQFGKLQSNTSGKCCITLNAQENTNLGVLISNIYLYQNGSEGEVLKVITMDHGSDFVLKEYYSRASYQPLLLTEAQRVYIQLHYKVGNVPPNELDSHFNLEVFSYHRYGNYIHHESSYTESYFPYL